MTFNFQLHFHYLFKRLTRDVKVKILSSINVLLVKFKSSKGNNLDLDYKDTNNFKIRICINLKFKKNIYNKKNCNLNCNFKLKNIDKVPIKIYLSNKSTFLFEKLC